MKANKLGLVGLIVAGIGAVAGGESDGVIAIKNDTTWSGIQAKSQVTLVDNYSDVPYLEAPFSPKLISYIYDPNSPDGPILSGKGINPQNTNAVKIWFESIDVPPGIDHFLRLRIFSMGGLPADMNDYAFRNITLHQEPNNLNADPNLYDIKDLTNGGTRYGYIDFPALEGQWIFRSDNYADLTFNGKVDLEDLAQFSSYWANTSCDPNNHWCDFADLDRSGRVDFGDFARMSLEWFYDTNDPNTW